MRKPYLSPAFCAKNSVLILEAQTAAIRIGMVNCSDEETKNRLQNYFSEYTIIFIPISSDDFSLLLSRLFASEPPAQNKEAEENDFAIDEIADDAPVINLLNNILLEGLNRLCSDIHIESLSTASRVRFRQDGILATGMELSAERAASLSVRLKMMANLNVLEKRRPQDGRLNIQSGGIPLDVRLSILPSVYGESIVLRLLNTKREPFSLQKLGFSAAHMQLIQELLNLPCGLILLTGPTGSGKTTTLSTLLTMLNHEEVKIISLEDPVEYRIDGITQIQTDDEVGITFESLLRRILRHDPDIIMIGEIRDMQTAELAVRTALTGHLVFATLHTNNACEAPIRLNDMGIPFYLIAAVLKAVISQRLVRTLSAAKDKKYAGRTLLAEILFVNHAVESLLAQHTSRAELEHCMKEQNQISIKQDAEQKIRSGITDHTAVKKELGVSYDK